MEGKKEHHTYTLGTQVCIYIDIYILHFWLIQVHLEPILELEKSQALDFHGLKDRE